MYRFPFTIEGRLNDVRHSGAAVGIEVGVWSSLVCAGLVLVLGFVFVQEVAEDDGQDELIVHFDDVAACVPWLEFAGAGAAIVVEGISVIALVAEHDISWEEDAVTAGRAAGTAGCGAAGFEAAEGGTSVAHVVVAIIALLSAFFNPVAANGFNAGRSGCWADPAASAAGGLGFYAAGTGATIIVGGVSVVAGFVAGDDAVAAFVRDAGLTGEGAAPAGLDAAGAGATIAVDVVAVIAGFGARDKTVSAGEGFALCAYAGPAGFNAADG